MDQDILYTKEKLNLLEKGKSYPVEKSQTVYSAIRDNPDLFKNKEFSIRTDKKPTVLPSGESKFLQRVIRIK
jgi:hypothetical protein